MEKMYLDKIAKKKPKSFMLENAECVFFIVLSRQMNLFIRKKKLLLCLETLGNGVHCKSKTFLLYL